MQKLKLIII